MSNKKYTCMRSFCYCDLETCGGFSSYLANDGSVDLDPSKIFLHWSLSCLVCTRGGMRTNYDRARVKRRKLSVVGERPETKLEIKRDFGAWVCSVLKDC